MAFYKNIAITGGGTGGHLVVAKVIKEELNRRGIKPIYIGSLNGQDIEWFGKDEGFKNRYFFDSSGVVNKNFFGKINSLMKIISFTFRANKILKREKIDIIFSVGGYSASPASLSIFLSKRLLFIHEQNSKMGSLNSFLLKKAKVLFSSYELNSPVKEYPIEEKFFKTARDREEIKTILFLGGSQGAKAINDFAIKIAHKLTLKHIKIIHQTGKKEYKRVEKFYKDNNIDADVFAFSTQLEKKMAKADFAISRAGASTLWALCANRLPTLFIPYPYAYKNHQYFNAKFLEEKGLALIAMEEDLTPNLIDRILKKDIKMMSRNLKNVISPNGAKKIVDLILDSRYY